MRWCLICLCWLLSQATWAAPNYIGPESNFTHELKPLNTAAEWRTKLGIIGVGFSTNYTYITNLYVTNFYAGDTVTINTNVYLTNTYLFINGTNVATVNPTDLYVPARGNATNFVDTALHLDAIGSSDLTLDGDMHVQSLLIAGLSSGPAWLIDQGGGEALLTNGTGWINPTSPYVPYNNAGTFADSWWYYTANGMGIDTNVYWGPGTTNALYRSGRDLVYSNSVTTVDGVGFTLRDGSDNIGKLLVTGHVLALAPLGNAVEVDIRDGANNVVKWYNKQLTPSQTGSELGAYSSLSPYLVWSNLWLNGKLSLEDPTLTGTANYSRLMAYHGGTSGNIIFDSQTAGTGGAPVTSLFEANGTNFVEIGWDGSFHPMVKLSEPGRSEHTSLLQVGGVGTFTGTTLNITESSGALFYTPNISFFQNDGLGNPVISLFGYYASVGNSSRLTISHSGTNGSIIFDSQSAGTAGSPRNFLFSGAVVDIERNVGALLSDGDTTFVDMTKASQTNSVSGALTFAHATNGVDGVDLTHVRWLFNSSGSDQTLTIPTGWRTNVFSPLPPALTNATITKIILNCGGATDTAAKQTNCYVSFEYFK